ncbi:DUF2889 domain-containing protein [Candidimonas nitroreducens]|uniref:DUF2889 domain-containing protein n=1 Tax=Candidimonas nitroreducens TaxID=683354 RepID=A0A225MKB4_9BURK|nr:DUF2889 domain-containing protein [Candidimonas nitroreducens]OWT61694.1 hypothetical protein CEY11_07535 [Candidimonas nitroreducens]
MPLPSPSCDRELLHVRKIECQGFRRSDGMFDVEGRMVDRKTYDISRLDGGRSVAAGDAIHDMSIRITIDESLFVHAVDAAIDASPYVICPQAVYAMQQIVGLTIASGWTRAVKERLGGARGCTHLMELLGPMATTAYQTLVVLRWARPDKLDRQGKPVKIDSCYAYGSSRQVVRDKWPAFYTGADAKPDS